jgi:porin
VETTQFYQGIASGGIDQVFRYGGRNDYYIALDGGKAGLQPGFFLTLHGESRYGEDVTDLDGVLLPTNFAMNVPSPGRSITALTAVKLTQALSEDFVLFGGKLNLIDDYTLNYSGGRGVDRFQNTSLVFQPILTRVMPYSTFGMGAAMLHEGVPVASLAIVDAVDRSTTAAVDDAYEEGAVILAEGRLPVEICGLRGTHVVGAAWSSREYVALADTPLLVLPPAFGQVAGRQSGSWATYYNFDQTLWVDPSDPARTWGMFATAGVADRATSPLHWATTIGMGGNVPWHFRPQDEFGAGYYYLGGSPDLKDALPVLLPLQDGQGIELYYKANVTRWFALTPNIQFLQPGQERVDDSVIAGLRGKLTF